MTRANKLYIFLGLISFLSLGLSLIYQEKLSSTALSAFTTCQSFIGSQDITFPQAVILLPVLLLTLIFSILVIKFSLSFIKINILLHKKGDARKNLYKLFEKRKLTGKVVIVKNNKSFAFCFGIIRPKIYISTGLLDIVNTKELEAILIHERYHLRSRDTISTAVISTIESLFLFFPVVLDILRNFQIRQELKADQEVIKTTGSSRAILSVLKKLIKSSSDSFQATPAIASRYTLEPRINSLVNKDIRLTKIKLANLLVSVISGTILVMMVYSPVHALDLHASETSSVLVCLSSNKCVTACKNERIEASLRNSSYPNMNASYSPFE